MNRDIFLPMTEKKYAKDVYGHEFQKAEDSYSRIAHREKKRFEMVELFLSLATVFGVAPFSFVIFGILHAHLGLNLFVAAVSMMALPIVFSHILSGLIQKEYEKNMDELKNEMLD